MRLDQRLHDLLRRNLNSLEGVGSWVKALFTAESASLKKHYRTQAWAIRPAGANHCMKKHRGLANGVSFR
jgi:hypothetical protein